MGNLCRTYDVTLEAADTVATIYPCAGALCVNNLVVVSQSFMCLGIHSLLWSVLSLKFFLVHSSTSILIVSAITFCEIADICESLNGCYDYYSLTDKCKSREEKVTRSAQEVSTVLNRPITTAVLYRYTSKCTPGYSIGFQRGLQL